MKNLLKAIVLSVLLTAAAYAGQSVNVNTADAATIAASLNGIGLAKAEAIIDYREANGPFADADQLVNVKGVGLKTVEKNREYILVSE